MFGFISAFANSTEKPLEPLTGREAWQLAIVTQSLHNRAMDTVVGEYANIREPLTIQYSDAEVAYRAILLLSRTDSERGRRLAERLEAVQISVSGGDIIAGLFGDEGKTVDVRSVVLADSIIQQNIAEHSSSVTAESLIYVWPEVQQTFQQGVALGIEQGYIPEEVADRVDPALRRTSVRVVDAVVMDVCIENADAAYNTDLDEIWVRDDIGPTQERVKAIIHELTHKISGGTFTVSENIAKRPRTGFSTEITPDNIQRVALTEALTEHVACGLVDGDFETVDPARREDSKGGYLAYRIILADFIEKSKGLISVKTMTRAFFEDTTIEGNTELRRQFIREVTNVYGRGALGKLERLMKCSGVSRMSRIRELCNRMTAPVIDQNGTIRQRGLIDVVNLPSVFKINS